MNKEFIEEILCELQRINKLFIIERTELFELLKNPIFTQEYKEASQYEDWGALPSYKVPLTAKTIFYRYKYGYYEAACAISKELLSSKKKVLFYPYCFLFSHYLELVIKEFIVNDLPGFNDTKINHNLVNLYEQNKQNLINIGLNEKYFHIFIKELKKFQNLVSKEDMSMCYRYPVNISLEKSIIKKSVLVLPFQDIKETLEHHSIIYSICSLMCELCQLASIKKYKEKCKKKLTQMS